MTTTAPTLDATQLTDRLWTGGSLPESRAEAMAAVDALERLGVGLIIDTRSEWSDEHVVSATATDITYVHAGVDDRGQRMADAWFDRVTAVALDHIGRGRGVLVHCHMGINRGPSAAFAVLLATGRDPVEAIDLIRACRPIASVCYAEDALDWWHRRTGTPSSLRATQRRQMETWRRAHPHDTVRIIRSIRLGEIAFGGIGG